MDTRTLTTFFSLLALACTITAVGGVGVWIASRYSPAAAELRERIRESAHSALVLAWVIALGATLGSLYYSEVANFEPCRLCWFQRIGMYPLVAVLGIGALRRDLAVRFYAYPLVAGGGAVAAYHYLIQRFPDLDSGSCTVGVPCSLIWVERFGFVTIAYMALSAFAAIGVLLLLSARRNEEERRSARAGVAESL